LEKAKHYIELLIDSTKSKWYHLDYIRRIIAHIGLFMGITSKEPKILKIRGNLSV
jgi:hypothetical protein